jgi:uncharacterized protein YkwD
VRWAATAATAASLLAGSPAATVLQLVNRERERAGLPPLRADRRLTTIAHRCPESTLENCSRRLDRHVREVAENTVWDAASPGEAVRLWLASPPHRAALLGRWRLTGVAVLGIAPYPTYVQVFAR